jgi:putative endonuclease
MDRNFRVRRGEVDLIFRDGGTIVFAEVKTRRGSAFGDPAQAVTERKQEQIAAVALVYLQKRELPLSTSCRFDVLAVLADGDRARITHFRNAFPFRSRYD